MSYWALDRAPAVAPVLPGHDLLRPAWVRQFGRNSRRGAGRENAERRTERTEDLLQPAGQFACACRRLDRTDARDGRCVPVGRGRFIAGVEVADVAKQPCEGDKVLQAPALQWPGRLPRRHGGCTGVLQAHVVEPGHSTPVEE